MVDTTKKSNIKCEHCVFWDKSEDDYITEDYTRKYLCVNKKSYKAYWCRCKDFQWREDILEA